MDNPDHCVKRSLNLNKFRDQKRQFNRASSFTFGQAQHASMMLRTAEATGAAAAANGYGRSRRPVSSSAYSQKPLELPGFEFPIASKKSSLAAAPRDGHLTAVTPSAVAASTAGLSITEEDHEGDSSFGTNGSSPGGPAGGSPCPPSSKMGTRPSLKLGSGGTALFQRKGLERAATSSVLTFSRR